VEIHGQHRFLHQFGSERPDDVATQQGIGLGVGQILTIPLPLPLPWRARWR
jgi:hypothetical protein